MTFTSTQYKLISSDYSYPPKNHQYPKYPIKTIAAKIRKIQIPTQKPLKIFPPYPKHDELQPVTKRLIQIKIIKYNINNSISILRHGIQSIVFDNRKNKTTIFYRLKFTEQSMFSFRFEYRRVL
jgi:hypothetical protein